MSLFLSLINDEDCLRYYFHGHILREIKTSVSLDSYLTLDNDCDIYVAIRF